MASSVHVYVGFAFAVLLLSVSAKGVEKSQDLWSSFRDELLPSSRNGGVCRGALVKQKGFRALVLYVADGEFDPFVPNPLVPNCLAGFCEATYFWQNIAVASDKVRAKETSQAKKFYAEKWGIPVDDYVAEGKIGFFDNYLDPRLNYRCRALEGQKVHRFGWEVHDQFFLVTALKELTLGGQFGKGRTVPPNTFLLFGQYKIERSQVKKGKVVGLKKFINIRYESTDPVYPDVDGRRMASCRITQSPWGTGVAFLNVNVPVAGQKAKGSWRTVLTMDGGSGLGKFGGVYNM